MPFAHLGGLFVGLEPGTSNVYANRQAGGPWEELRILKRGQWYDLDFVAAGRPLRLNEQTRQLETGQDHEGWGGQWAIQGSTASIAGVTLELEGFQQVERPHLEVRGRDFINASGTRIIYPGCDAFPALRLFKDGGPEALSRHVQESQELGFKVWRIWSQGSKRQNNFLDLSPKESGYYEAIGPFCEYLLSQGIIPLLTAYVDNQDVQSPIDHWVRLGQITNGSILLSGFNQWSKNKSNFDPWALPPVPGIWSRGSDVDDVQTPPKGAPASELHATRTSHDRAVMDATASPPTMRQSGSTLVWMTEGAPFDQNSSLVEAWERARAYSVLWGLAIFHNRQGQFGELLTGRIRECAVQWVAGMTL